MLKVAGSNVKSPRNQILHCPADDISLICICSLPPHSLMMDAPLHSAAVTPPRSRLQTQVLCVKKLPCAEEKWSSCSDTSDLLMNTNTNC